MPFSTFSWVSPAVNRSDIWYWIILSEKEMQNDREGTQSEFHGLCAPLLTMDPINYTCTRRGVCFIIWCAWKYAKNILASLLLCKSSPGVRACVCVRARKCETKGFGRRTGAWLEQPHLNGVWETQGFGMLTPVSLSCQTHAQGAALKISRTVLAFTHTGIRYDSFECCAIQRFCSHLLVSSPNYLYIHTQTHTQLYVCVCDLCADTMHSGAHPLIAG